MIPVLNANMTVSEGNGWAGLLFFSWLSYTSALTFRKNCGKAAPNSLTALVPLPDTRVFYHHSVFCF